MVLIVGQQPEKDSLEVWYARWYARPLRLTHAMTSQQPGDPQAVRWTHGITARARQKSPHPSRIQRGIATFQNLHETWTHSLQRGRVQRQS